MDFTRKNVLVTGGSRGIGRAISLEFAKLGANVIIQYLSNKQAADDTLTSLPGNSHFIIQADVADPLSVQHMMESIISRTGTIDIVINNAGIFEDHPIQNISYDEWQKAWNHTLSVNLTGPANVMYWATQYMIKNGGGRIVNISSRGAFRGEPEAPAYGASKAGLNALSQSLAKQLAPYKIYITAIAPCFVETEMTADILNSPQGDEIKKQSPIGRVAKPEEIARAAVFLASEGTEYFTGAILDVNGASYLRT